jgi:hypothetical protein
MADYEFESIWVFDADAAAVFEALRDYKRYPAWWPDVREVSMLQPGNETGIGLVVGCVVTSPLRYSLGFNVTLERLEPLVSIATRSEGDLVGTGVWTLAESDGQTTARYAWHVATTKWWMNFLAPLARPLFSWAHSRVMARGARGLAAHIGASLVSAS